MDNVRRRPTSDDFIESVESSSPKKIPDTIAMFMGGEGEESEGGQTVPISATAHTLETHNTPSFVCCRRTPVTFVLFSMQFMFAKQYNHSPAVVQYRTNTTPMPHSGILSMQYLWSRTVSIFVNNVHFLLYPGFQSDTYYYPLSVRSFSPCFMDLCMLPYTSNMKYSTGGSFPGMSFPTLSIPPYSFLDMICTFTSKSPMLQCSSDYWSGLLCILNLPLFFFLIDYLLFSCSFFLF